MKLAAVAAIVVASYLWQAAYEAALMWNDLRKATDGRPLAFRFAWIALGSAVWACGAMALAAAWLE